MRIVRENSFMIESVVVFGKAVPMYGICFYAGIIFAAGVASLICKKRSVERFDLVGAAVYTMIMATIGAKALFIAVSFRQIVEYHLSLEAVLKGGFVFYGGLIGGVLGLFIYCKQFKIPFFALADLFAVVLPLGHAFGRVGCFCAGCCYGMPFDSPISVTYTRLENTNTTPLGVPLFPIQLVEAGCLLVVFAVMLICFCKRPMERGRYVAMYALSYSVIRFTLEFFRGDGIRGAFLGLSTSQWISVGIFTLTLILLIAAKKKIRPGAEKA